MKLFNQSLACLMFVTGLLSPLCLSAASPSDDPQPARWLMLAANADGGGKHCEIPATEDLRINLNRDDEDRWNCTNDEMSYFKLDNVRSAAYLSLGNDTCGQGNSWVFKIKTIIDPISTPWIPIESLKGKLKGEIISRGIVMAEDGYNGGDQIKGKLTCVIIDVSEPG